MKRETPERPRKAGRPAGSITYYQDFFEVCFYCPYQDCLYKRSWKCPLVKAEKAQHEADEKAKKEAAAYNGREPLKENGGKE